MKRMRVATALTIGVLLASSAALRADVRTDEKSKFSLGGAMGKIVNFFGGKAAKEGITSTVAVKGDRKITFNDATGQIVDLNEEKVYDLDMKKKAYKVTTFAELRRQMQEARKKAEEESRKAAAEAKDKKAEPTPAPQKPEKELEVDFDLKDTGQKKAINGFDTHEVVMTITMREKGKKLEESGGMVLTSDMWLAPAATAAGTKEIGEFDLRYAKKLEGPTVAGASAQDMAAATAMYPMLKNMIGRMNTENVKMDGVPVLTTTTIDAVKSAEEVANEQKQSQEDSKPKASGGLGGLLSRAAAKKVAGSGDAPKDRATVMTMNHEILKITRDVSAAEVAIPAGFKENK